MSLDDHGDGTPRRTPGQLIAELGDVLDDSCGPVWVCGVITGVRTTRGWTNAELIEHGPDNTTVTGRVRVAFAPRTFSGASGLVDGAYVEVLGRLRAHATFGPVRFVGHSAVVVESQSSAAIERAEMLRELMAAKAHRINAQLPLSEDANHLAVICPLGTGAGGRDFVDRLRADPAGWNLEVIETPMGGPSAPQSVAAAISRANQSGVHAVVVCRGGGSASELSVFDDRRIVDAIVSSPIPVVVAVGHLQDRHLADHVAHVSLQTPTAAAHWFMSRRTESQRRHAAGQLAAQQQAAYHQLTEASRRESAAAERLAEAEAERRRARQATYAAVVLIVVVLLTAAALLVL